MASQVICDLCQDEPAAVMQSSLTDGQTVAIGASCALPFYLTTISAILDQMPAEVAREYGAQLAEVITKLASPAEPVKPVKPARKPRDLPTKTEPDDTGQGGDDGET